MGTKAGKCWTQATGMGCCSGEWTAIEAYRHQPDLRSVWQFFIAVVPACVLFMGFSIFMANNLTVVLTTPRLFVNTSIF